MGPFRSLVNKQITNQGTMLIRSNQKVDIDLFHHAAKKNLVVLDSIKRNFFQEGDCKSGKVCKQVVKFSVELIPISITTSYITNVKKI